MDKFKEAKQAAEKEYNRSSTAGKVAFVAAGVAAAPVLLAGSLVALAAGLAIAPAAGISYGLEKLYNYVYSPKVPPKRMRKFSDAEFQAWLKRVVVSRPEIAQLSVAEQKELMMMMRFELWREAAQKKQAAFKDMDVFQFNFAITGHTGHGKSSLINGLLSHVGAAPVSGYRVGNDTVHKYVDPDHGFIAYWDMPGAGTDGHPAATYFEDKMLAAFDVVVIVLGNRILDEDKALLAKCAQEQVPVILVRSCIDRTVMDACSEADPSLDVDQPKQAPAALIDMLCGGIRDYVKEQFSPDQQVMIVSSKRMLELKRRSAWEAAGKKGAPPKEKCFDTDEVALIEALLLSALQGRGMMPQPNPP